jgi:two-component sensor histidine kinase/streptogramin lyase
MAFSSRIGSRLGMVQSLYQDRQGDLWIGARGLARLPAADGSSEKQLQFFDGDPVLAHNDIFALSGDPAGNLWAAVSNLGVLRILRSGFSNYTEADGLESTAVLSVFEAHDGGLYAVTGARHTLNHFEQGRFSAIKPVIPASIRDFGWGEASVALQDRRGQWWLASMNGLLRYPKVARASDLAHTRPDKIYRLRDGLTSEGITRLFEDRDGGIWIGCAEGVSRWDPGSGRTQNLTLAVQAALGRTPVPLSFAQDEAGQVWIGFFNGGLVRYRSLAFQRVDKGLPAGSINWLLCDHAGRLWIASAQGGLGRIDAPADKQPVSRRYSDVQGLRSNQLFALAEDRVGRIYIAGGQGVDWLDPDTDVIHHFASGSVLPPGEIQRMHGDREGAIWFASHFGLSRYLPGTTAAGKPPSPAIREVRVSGAAVIVSDEGEPHVGGLAFGAGKDSVEIGFGAVDFSVGSRVRYRYRLLPVESEWRQPATARSAQYAGIGPGAYRFEVQAVSPTGGIGAEVASVAFSIDWPFWKTWWFRLLTVSFVVSLALAAHYYRVRHLLALERVRTRLAADLHDDLGSGLAEIAILTEVARTQHRPGQLDTVAQRARELRGAMADIVWSVDPSRDNLEDLVRRFRQTAAAMLGDDRLEFITTSDGTGKVELTPDRRRNLLLMFKEIVTNVARHAHATKVIVRVLHTPGGLELEVRDNGCGFRPEEVQSGNGFQSGNGLRTMAQRAEALSARLEIDSTLGFGTTVRLRAPLR